MISPTTTHVQTNGAAALVKSAVSAAIIEAVQHAHPHGNGSLATTDRNEFVREVLTMIHVRASFLFSSVIFHSFPVVLFARLMPRSWMDFRWGVMGGRGTSTQPCVLIAVASCLCPPLPSPVHVVLHRDISVHVLLRDVLTCTDMY